jgi:phytoene/squalene synthetase
MSSRPINYFEIFSTIDFEKIIDRPNILIAASFWEEDRYAAARVCYKLMRFVDDLVDNYKTNHKIITAVEKEQLTTEVKTWINAITDSSNNCTVQNEIVETFEKYKIPVWSMDAFAKSMLYDIQNDGFSSLQAFLDYAQGAAVAPASIFVHLCGLTEIDGKYTAPDFDVKEAATSCAIFSYLIHIIRDFQKDQFSHLNYFADDIIEKNGLDRNKLNDMAHGRTVINDGFRNLIQEYYVLADRYRLKTYDVIKRISPCLEPRYQLSIEIIFNLYLMVFERIDIKQGNFTAKELNPTPEEIKQLVYKVIRDFNDGY